MINSAHLLLSVLSIVPSCEYCTGAIVAAFNWKDCYHMQKAACSQRVYCPTYCSCQEVIITSVFALNKKLL